MKNLIILFCLGLFSQINAQKVMERVYTSSLGDQNAFMVDHPEAEKGTVEDVLDDMIGEYGKVKRNRKAKEWNCMACSVPGLGTMDIYYKVEEGKGQTTSYLFLDDGSKFLSKENAADAYDKIEKINREIFYEVKRRVVKKELEDQEDDLKDLEKDLSKLVDKNEDLHDDIEDYKEKIIKAEKDIEKNLQEQEDKKIEIEQQRKTVDKTTDRLNNIGR